MKYRVYFLVVCLFFPRARIDFQKKLDEKHKKNVMPYVELTRDVIYTLCARCSTNFMTLSWPSQMLLCAGQKGVSWTSRIFFHEQKFKQNFPHFGDHRVHETHITREWLTIVYMRLIT